MSKSGEFSFGNIVSEAGKALSEAAGAAREAVNRTLGRRDAGTLESIIGDTAYFKVTQPFNFNVATSLAANPQFAGVRSVFVEVDNGAAPIGTISGISSITATGATKVAVIFKAIDPDDIYETKTVELGGVAYSDAADPDFFTITNQDVTLDLITFRNTTAATPFNKYALVGQGEAAFNATGVVSGNNCIELIGPTTDRGLAQSFGLCKNTLAIEGQVPALETLSAPYLAAGVWDGKIYPTSNGGFQIFCKISSASQGFPSSVPSQMLLGVVVELSYPMIRNPRFNSRGMLLEADSVFDTRNTGLNPGNISATEVPWHGLPLASGETLNIVGFKTEPLPGSAADRASGGAPVSLIVAYGRYKVAGNSVSGAETGGVIQTFGIADPENPGETMDVGVREFENIGSTTLTLMNSGKIRRIAVEGINPDQNLLVLFGQGTRPINGDSRGHFINGTNPTQTSILRYSKFPSNLANPPAAQVNSESSILITVASNQLKINPFYDPQGKIGNTETHLVADGTELTTSSTVNPQRIVVPASVQDATIVFFEAGQYTLVNNSAGRISFAFPHVPSGYNLPIIESRDDGVVSTTVRFPGGVNVTFYNEDAAYIRDEVIAKLATTTVNIPTSVAQSSQAPTTAANTIPVASLAPTAGSSMAPTSTSTEKSSAAASSVASSDAPSTFTSTEAGISDAASSSQPFADNGSASDAPIAFNISTVSGYQSSAASTFMPPFTSTFTSTSNFSTIRTTPRIGGDDAKVNLDRSGAAIGDDKIAGIAVGGFAAFLLGLLLLWKRSKGRNRVASIERGEAGRKRSKGRNRVASIERVEAGNAMELLNQIAGAGHDGVVPTEEASMNRSQSSLASTALASVVSIGEEGIDSSSSPLIPNDSMAGSSSHIRHPVSLNAGMGHASGGRLPPLSQRQSPAPSVPQEPAPGPGHAPATNSSVRRATREPTIGAMQRHPDPDLPGTPLANKDGTGRG